MKNAFTIGENLTKRNSFLIEILGLFLILLIWSIATYPVKETHLTFSTINGTNPNYVWSNDAGFEQTFDGDNTISGVTYSSYNFKFTDENKISYSDKITVPDTLTSTTFEKFFETKQYNVDSQLVEVYVKIETKKDGMFVSHGILPFPPSVFASYSTLFSKFDLVKNTSYSLFINIAGYVIAIVFSIIFGYIIGLIPFFKALLYRWVTTVRFIPLNAVTGLFAVWFGMNTYMKVEFLAFGIIVYLLPVVVQRIAEVEKVYLQTAYTLGATKWQQIRYVYWPHVASKLIDDIRVLTAISWTYIIIAELYNKTYGLGTIIYYSQRMQTDMLFALLLLIILIGIVQDFIFVKLDNFLFPYKKVQRK